MPPPHDGAGPSTGVTAGHAGGVLPVKRTPVGAEEERGAGTGTCKGRFGLRSDPKSVSAAWPPLGLL